MANSVGEGVRLLKIAKERDALTTQEVAEVVGYRSRDAYHKLCRYEFEPNSKAAGKIAEFIGMPRSWVMDHWASEVERRKRSKIRRSA